MPQVGQKRSRQGQHDAPTPLDGNRDANLQELPRPPPSPSQRPPDPKRARSSHKDAGGGDRRCKKRRQRSHNDPQSSPAPAPAAASAASAAAATAAAAPAASTPATVATDAAMLAAGTAVVVQGLQGAPQHNGRRGVVQKFDRNSGRYVVSLQEHQSADHSVLPAARLALRPTRVAAAESPAAAQAAGGADAGGARDSVLSTSAALGANTLLPLPSAVSAEAGAGAAPGGMRESSLNFPWQFASVVANLGIKSEDGVRIAEEAMLQASLLFSVDPGGLCGGAARHQSQFAVGPFVVVCLCEDQFVVSLLAQSPRQQPS